MAGSATGKLEGLDGFEKLDIGELYYIGERRFVERGLAYYRQFAVESLEWDGRKKLMVALVQGSRSIAYEVWLQVRDGRLIHECECPAWDRFGGCKHAVAAAAAMFLSVQGVSMGGYAMPDDYAQELRKQLGYRDVGGGGHKGEIEVPEPDVQFLLTESNSAGGLSFSILGRVPTDFLRSFGITLGSSYGFRLAREFRLNDPDKRIGKFLKKAKAEKIDVVAMIEGQGVPLKLAASVSDMEIQLDLDSGSVIRRLHFLDSKGASLDVVQLISNSSLVLTSDGALHPVREHESGLCGNMGPLRASLDAESYNEQSLTFGGDSSASVFSLKRKPIKPKLYKGEDVRLELNLSAMENAAGEWEAFEFDCYFSVNGYLVDLHQLTSSLLAPVLNSYSGKLLSAKRRVRALTDLIRRVLSSEVTLKDLDLRTYADEFDELFSENYRVIVCGIVENLLRRIEAYGQNFEATLADDESGRWVRGELDVRKLAMLLYSLSDAASRSELYGLDEGSIGLDYPEAGAEALQRIVSVCRTLGVQVEFNEQAIRSEPLSISVDTKASGSDIDWFRLHPSIRCGERTIDPDEWQQLILGKLLIKDKDGGLIMPEFENDAGGLELLAELLKPKAKRRSDGETQPGDEGLQVSRLEMLDWIMLRRHGVQVRLPKEAEQLFANLEAFDGVGAFKQPSTLQAELRDYQKEGCAWIDFLYRHRFGACLADDMGLGKTVQTIAFLTGYFERVGKQAEAQVLIVLPPSLVFNWLEEFARFAPSISVKDCLKTGDWKKVLKKSQVILTTYDRLRIDQKPLENKTFEIVVFDEAHNLKNVNAARTKAAAMLQRRFTLCLTGTPVENNATEFYSVMTAAVPGVFGTLKAFKDCFRQSPDRILGRSRPFILRRTKAKILKELPKKEEHELFLQMSELQKEIYTRAVAEVKAEVADAYEDRPEQQAGIVALAAILRLRQVCVSPALLGKDLPEPAPKFAYMADRLEELHSEGHGALVFSQFIGGLDQMEVIAKERGIDYLRMDGRTPVAKRKEIVQKFQSGEGPAFFFISLKTGGVGLNLTRANYVFHLDPWWNPAVENQASDRAHRIGQTRSVFVQRLIMQHSIEARMLELKARKAELFRRLVDEPGSQAAAKGLSRDDFDYLLNG